MKLEEGCCYSEGCHHDALGVEAEGYYAEGAEEEGDGEGRGDGDSAGSLGGFA